MSILHLFQRRCRDCGEPKTRDHLCPDGVDATAGLAVTQTTPGVVSVGEHGYFFSPAKVIELAGKIGHDVDAVEALMRVAVQHAMDREGVPALPIVLTDVIREGRAA